MISTGQVCKLKNDTDNLHSVIPPKKITYSAILMRVSLQCKIQSKPIHLNVLRLE